jgi:hypothetical protein
MSFEHVSNKKTMPSFCDQQKIRTSKGFSNPYVSLSHGSWLDTYHGRLVYTSRTFLSVNKFGDDFPLVYTSRTFGIHITDVWYIHHGRLVYTSRTKVPHEPLWNKA